MSAGLRVRLDSCLVLPDYRVGDQQTASMPRNRILDAEEFDFLGLRVQQILPPGEATEVASRVRAFLCNELNVVQDFSVRHQQIRKTNRRLSEGLATWVPRIRPESGGIVVTGTAGLGSTLDSMTVAGFGMFTLLTTLICMLSAKQVVQAYVDTQGAQRSLTLRPAGSPRHFNVPLHRRLQPFRYLHDCSDCYRPERVLPGGIRTHWKSAAFARRTSNSCGH